MRAARSEMFQQTEAGLGALFASAHSGQILPHLGRNAVQQFQQGRGLQPNGQLNPPTLAAMGLPPDSLAYR